MKTVTNENAGIIKVANGRSQKNLYIHQVEAIKALDENINAKNFYRGLLVIPTGGGKTLTAVQWILRNVLNKNGKVLWIAHRHELLNQALKAFKDNSYSNIVDNIKEFKYRVVSGMHDKPIHIQPDDDVIIASKDSLNHGMNYLIENWIKQNKNNIFLVIDEAHHAIAKSYRNIINTLEKYNDKKFKMLGLTATPFRTFKNEEGLLKKIFQDDITYSIDLKTLILREILAEPIIIDSNTQIDISSELTDKDIKLIHKSGNLPEDIANSIALNKNRNNHIVNHYLKNKNKYGQTLVFALNVNHAIELKALFEKNGVKADFVVSDIKDSVTGVTISNEENFEKIRDFKARKLNVLINVNILTEGTDIPNIQTVFLTRPTISTTLMNQMIGRALRGKHAGGTEKAYVVSFFDDWKNKISWVNPRKLNESNNIFRDGKYEQDRRILKLIAISKIEEFTKTIDQTVDTEQIERVPFIERIPVGAYFFSILIPICEGDEPEQKNCEVMVYDTYQQAYEDFINELEYIFKDKKIENKEYLSSSELDSMCESVKEDYFKGYETKIAWRDEDIKDILSYYAQTSVKPTFMPFAERDKCDISKIAKYFWDNEVGPKKQKEYMETLWNDDKNFIKLFFNENKKFFYKEVSNELDKLKMEDDNDEKEAEIIPENIDIKKLSLWEIKNIDVKYWRKVVNSVYGNAKDEEGYYHSAISNFKSKYKRDFQIDHIKPISKGGLTEISNLQLLSRKENVKKSDYYTDNISITRDYIIKETDELINNKEYRKAREIIMKYLDKNNDAEIYNKLGYICYLEKDYDSHMKSYVKAINIDPNYAKSYYNIALTYFDNNDYTNCEYYLNMLLKINDKYCAAIELLADVTYRKDSFEEAVKLYDKAIEIKSDDDELYNKKGNVLYFGLNDFEDALKAYSKGLKINPNNKYIYTNLGDIFFNKENYNASLIYYNKAIELDETCAYAYDGRALCYLNLKMYDKVLNDFYKAVELDPEFEDAYFDLACELDRKRRYKEAIKNYEKVIELNDKNIDAFNNMGYTYFKMKDYKNALQSYNRALKIDPNYETTRCNKKRLLKVINQPK